MQPIDEIIRPKSGNQVDLDMFHITKGTRVCLENCRYNLPDPFQFDLGDITEIKCRYCGVIYRTAKGKDDYEGAPTIHGWVVKREPLLGLGSIFG